MVTRRDCRRGKYKKWDPTRNNSGQEDKNVTTSKRTIILVELPWGRDKDPRVPLGHASLLTSLKKIGNGEIISIVSPINDDTTTPEILNNRIMCITESADDIDLAIGAYVWAEEVIIRLLPMLRASGFTGRIILGGPQISYTPDGLEELYPEADVFVRGYGEIAIVALFNDPGKKTIDGVHFSGQVDRNKQTSVDLSLLPSPWLSEAIDINDQKFVRWESQRGCAFRCSFCQHKEAGKRLKRREFDERRVMDEIDLFCRSEVEEIAVLDPIFNMSPIANQILQQFIDNGYTGRLSLQCRAEKCDDEFLGLVSELDVKLEFGLQTIHKDEGKAVDRINNMRFVNKWLDRVNGLGIDYEVSIIFGLPNQTLESFRQTVDWCLKKGVPVIKAFPLMLLRGTQIEQRRGEWGLIESEGSMPVVRESHTFTHQEWCQMDKLSNALSETEGDHPKSISELSRIANSLDTNMARFYPMPISV
jgi:radical SAM superfamily enzyme YgiQ (UPF0313 family)